jgi:predicted N-acetyltransferase YhbS
MNGINLRDARADEREEIIALTLAAYDEYTALPLWEGYRRSILATLASPAPAAQIVAEQRGALFGSVLLYPAPTRTGGQEGVCELRLLAVSPDVRRAGIGAALVQECIARAQRAGAPAIILHTAPFMERALRLYSRLGFRAAPELDYSPSPDVLLNGFRLALSATTGNE